MASAGVIFIKLLDALRGSIDVFKLSEAILEQLESGVVLTRFTCRMIPIF